MLLFGDSMFDADVLSRHHSNTLPAVSYSPQLFGKHEPTATVLLPLLAVQIKYAVSRDDPSHE